MDEKLKAYFGQRVELNALSLEAELGEELRLNADASGRLCLASAAISLKRIADNLDACAAFVRMTSERTE